MNRTPIFLLTLILLVGCSKLQGPLGGKATPAFQTNSLTPSPGATNPPFPPANVVLHFKYPGTVLVTNGFDLLASSNLVDWYIYPTNKYASDGTTLTVTNEAERLFFRVKVY